MKITNKFNPGIKLRMGLLSSLITSLVYVISALIVLYSISNSIENNLDVLLLEEIESVERLIVFDEQGHVDLFATPNVMHHQQASESTSISYLIRSMQGDILLKSTHFDNEIPPMAVFSAGQIDEIRLITINSEVFRIRSRIHRKETHLGNEDVVVQVVHPWGPYKAQTQQLAWLLVIMFPILFISMFGLGWWITRMMIKPVTTIMSTVDQITARDLSMRIQTTGNDEISLLGDKFNSLLDRVEDSFTILKQFTADASHELRTPLTRIRSQAEVTLSKPRSREEYQDSLGGILEGLSDMESMLEALLLLARSEGIDNNLKLEEQKLLILMTDIISNYEVIAEEKNITIETNFSGDISITLDSSLINIAFSNILLNALLYTPAGGKITVSLLSDNKCAMVSFCDTGPGIPGRERERVFQRFVRIHSEGQLTNGSGLGLAITQTIINLHHGNVWISNNNPIGSCVVVQLPLTKNKD